MTSSEAALPLGVAVLLALGCGGARPPVATSSTPATCTITGTARQLVVEVAGLAAEGARATGVPAEVSVPLEDGSEHATAHVLLPIDFAGTTRLPALAVVTRGVLRRGPLTVYAGAPVAALRATASGLRGRLALGATDGATGAGHAAILEVACDDVVLGEPGEPPEAAPDVAPPTHVVAGAQDLGVSEAPGAAPALLIALAGDDSEPIELEVLEEQEGWARVRSRFTWGELEGWIPTARMRAEPREAWDYRSSFGFGGIGACGRSDHPYRYRGPAVVRAGATVHDEATRVVWGRFVADTEVEVGVRLHDENGFAEVLSVDGIETPECGSLEFDHAMVLETAVVLP